MTGLGAEILLLGFLVGMQHAFEADHIAAVSSIAARQSSFRQIAGHGLSWGLGHAVTLLIVAGGAVGIGYTIDDEIARMMEVFVGVLLLCLGGALLFRLVREKIHFHVHRHADGTTHLHAHSHVGETLPHDRNGHEHVHGLGLSARSLAVGMMHGMAGSAALLIVVAAAVENMIIGLAYVALFGMGSIVGMAILSAVIAVPLAWSARAMTWLNRSLQSGVGVMTLVIGIVVIARNV